MCLFNKVLKDGCGVFSLLSASLSKSSMTIINAKNIKKLPVILGSKMYSHVLCSVGRLSISAVVMSYLQNPQPMSPPW